VLSHEEDLVDEYYAETLIHLDTLCTLVCPACIDRKTQMFTLISGVVVSMHFVLDDAWFRFR